MSLKTEFKRDDELNVDSKIFNKSHENCLGRDLYCGVTLLHYILNFDSIIMLWY